MKLCICCHESKPIEDYYRHPQMGDGHLNKCKACCRRQARERHYIKSRDDEWTEAERVRHREKFRRLGFKWTVSAINGTGAHSAAMRAVPDVPPGFERHHWSYQRQHWTDVIVLEIGYHRALHIVMSYDGTAMMFRMRRNHLLDTKAKHLRYAVAAWNVRARYQGRAA